MTGQRSCSLGSSLIDYVIPVSVIGIIAGLALFTIFEKGILTNFMAASIGAAKPVNGVLTLNSSGSTTPSELVFKGGQDTESNANSLTYDCADNACTVEYGGYTLEGVPENYADFVETNGVSPLPEQMAQLVYQLADQIEAEEPDNPDPIVWHLRNLAISMDRIVDFTYFYNEDGTKSDEKICIALASTQEFVEKHINDTEDRLGMFLGGLNPSGESTQVSKTIEKLDALSAYISENNEYEALDGLVNSLTNPVYSVNESFYNTVVENDCENNYCNFEDIENNVVSNFTDNSASAIDMLKHLVDE